MSILTLLKQDKEIRSKIRYQFQLLTLKQKLKFVLSLEELDSLSNVLLHNDYIPQGIDSSILDEIIPDSDVYKHYNLSYFRNDILDKYTEMYPYYKDLNLTELADVIVNDKAFIQHDPIMKVLIYMLAKGIGSFCYDW